MRRSLLSAALGLGLLVGSAALACDDDAKAEKFHKVTVDQLAKLIKDKQASVYDANGDETRTKYGIIPGATLLPTADKFDVAKVLPANKDQKLVFYCGGPKCMSSHHAAEKAVSAGYKDVNVLPEGITGWKSAGQATTPVSSPRS
jgi:rhodanese-related sulfurtransferase